MACLRAVLGLDPLPPETPGHSKLRPFSLDGGRTFLTTSEWCLLLGVSRQRVHQKLNQQKKKRRALVDFATT